MSARLSVLRGLLFGLGLAAFATSASAAIVCEPPGADLAVVVGNSDYSASGFDSIPNAVADAALVADALAARGFVVYFGKNLSREAMHAIVSQATICGGDRLVFYYAGQGFSYEGQAYALPALTGLSEEDRRNADVLAAKSVALDDLFRTTRDMPVVALFDGCTTDLLSLFGIGASPEFPVSLVGAFADLPRLQLVVFSGAVGSNVLDADPKDPTHGPFALALKDLLESGPDLEAGLPALRENVSLRTEGSQVPAWYRSPVFAGAMFGATTGRVIAYAADGAAR